MHYELVNTQIEDHITGKMPRYIGELDKIAMVFPLVSMCVYNC